MTQKISDSNGCDFIKPNKFQAYHLKPLGQFPFIKTNYYKLIAKYI